MSDPNSAPPSRPGGTARRVLVTGGNGRLGSAVTDDLLRAGHSVCVADRIARPGAEVDEQVILDLTDFDAVDGVLRSGGFDSVVHVAGMPGRSRVSGDVLFHNNMLTSYNVFTAAYGHGVRHLTFASSETILGLPFDVAPPYLPVDEETPDRFSSDYGLVKHLEERMAERLVSRSPDMTIAVMLLATVMTPDAYAQFAGFPDAPEKRRYNLWSYVDVRDAAQCFRLAVERREPGLERYIVAAADSVLARASADLAAEAFPGTPLRRPLVDGESLLSIDKARRMLGYRPAHSWRDQPDAMTPR